MFIALAELGWREAGSRRRARDGRVGGGNAFKRREDSQRRVQANKHASAFVNK